MTPYGQIHDACGSPIRIGSKAVGRDHATDLNTEAEANDRRALDDVVSEVTQLVLRERHSHDPQETSDQVRQAREMESAGRMVGRIAHEFNNLLTVVLGNSEICLDMLEPGSPLRSLVSDIEGAGHRAAQLTSQLLSFSRHTREKPDGRT